MRQPWHKLFMLLAHTCASAFPAGLSWKVLAWLPKQYIETENPPPTDHLFRSRRFYRGGFEKNGLQTLWLRMPISISCNVALGVPFVDARGVAAALSSRRTAVSVRLSISRPLALGNQVAQQVSDLMAGEHLSEMYH